MTGTIFDLAETDNEKPIQKGKEGFFEIAKNAPEPKDDSFFNSIKDYAKTIVKGSVEGLGKLGRIVGPLETGKSTTKQLEEQTENLNKILPTDEGFVQKSIRRGLKEAPSMLSFPGSTIGALPRSIAAGFAGEGAKELGAPEWAQSAAELTAFIGPDITKKLLTSGNNKELIDFAKKMGMTDQQITPLIQSEFKQKWLSKLSSKRGSTETALKETKKGLESIYNTIQKSEKAGLEISEKANGKLINGIYQKLSEMPRDVQNKILPDLQDLLSNKITGESLINFWKDINHNVGANSKQLVNLKEGVKQALSSISPGLANDFELVNKLYTKFYPIQSLLKPTLATDIVSAAETLGILGSTMMGHYPTLISVIGEKAARKVAQQMLINPRFQQISTKIAKAINQNKYGIIKKLTEELSDEVEKYSPKLAEKLENISDKDILEFFKRQDQKQETV